MPKTPSEHPDHVLSEPWGVSTTGFESLSWWQTFILWRRSRFSKAHSHLNQPNCVTIRWQLIWEVPIVETEALCQPNTKSNVLAEPGGGCYTWAHGEPWGREWGWRSPASHHQRHMYPAWASSPCFGWEVRREVCLGPHERGSIILCPPLTATSPQRFAGTVRKSPNKARVGTQSPDDIDESLSPPGISFPICETGQGWKN